MIDIHSHLVFGVDDGASSVKESVRMVLEAEKQGITDIIATPSFSKKNYNSGKVWENFQEIQRRTADFGVGLHLGYEVPMGLPVSDENIEMTSLTLAGSHYLLFELPFVSLPASTDDSIHFMHKNGIVPVIAHPEHNQYFVKDLEAFIGFIENGCLVQVDASSIIGAHSLGAKEFVKRLMKLNLVHFVASDSNCAVDYSQYYLPAYDQVKRWCGEDYARKLFVTNPKRVLNKAGL